MLSFAALSETAIAESTTTLDASAFMSGAAATASAGTIDYDTGEVILSIALIMQHNIPTEVGFIILLEIEPSKAGIVMLG